MKVKDIGLGNPCRKCVKITVVRKRIKPPIDKNFYYTQWEYCKNCNAVYFEEIYKSNDWKESEEMENRFQDNLFKN